MSDTRQRLIEAGERLFSSRGIDAPSLAEITNEAGLNNTGAVHYYFGGREELLEAITEQHRVGLDHRRDELFDQIEAEGMVSLDALVRALLDPLVEKLDDERGRAFLSIQAQRILRPRRQVELPRPLVLRLFEVFDTPIADHAVTSLLSEFGQLLAFGALARQARLESDPDVEPEMPRDEFVEQLVAAIVRVLQATPASDGSTGARA